MKLEATYTGASAIVNELSRAHVAFATNTLRETTFFEGVLGQPLAFREGLAALHAVVVSDLRYRPKDRLAFKAWLEEQDKLFLANLGVKSEKIREKIRLLEERKGELDAARLERRKPFHAARLRYFDWACTQQFELRYLYDPVITVHPDELSFEAFSKDESSYARLAARYDLFSSVKSFECGTTNIDFSARLAGQLERMRTYRETAFKVDPSGFAVQVGDAPIHKEKKIDLPDSWVMGFLQVHSVMTMGLTKFRIAPVDLFNVLRALRRKKARTSPRALRYELIPGERIRVVLEPWEDVIPLTETARWQGDKPLTFRTWGRDRLQTLARLIPVARSIDVHLAGYGLPSIYVVDLGQLTFTLALSGWTDQDWASDAGRFDLLSRKLAVTDKELDATYTALRATRYAREGSLAIAAKLDVDKARSALSYLCQTGRCMFDLSQGVYRHRDLFTTPFIAKGTIAAAEKAAEKGNPRAVTAREIFERGDAKIIAVRPVADGFKLSGSVRGGTFLLRARPQMHLDETGKIITASCTCSHYGSHKLTQGPCEHILALRLAHMARFEGKKGDS